MPSIKIIKLKVRRGSDAQRQAIVLNQGEFGYTIDTKRVFIGDGITYGGVVVGNKGHVPVTLLKSLTSTNAQKGDYVRASNLLYMLSGNDFTQLSSWCYIGPAIDNTTITLNESNQLQVASSSINASQLSPDLIGSGLEISSNKLQLDLNTQFFEFSASELSIAPNVITSREIATTALSSGLGGGNGTPLYVKVGSGLGYDETTETIVLCSYPDNSVSYNAFDASVIGSGLVLNPSTQKLETIVTNTDNASILKNSEGVIGLPVRGGSNMVELPYINYDAYGLPSSVTTSIFATLTGNSTSPAFSAFNGFPGQNTLGNNSNKIYTYPAIDLLGTTVTLSSAGFICFQGNVTARNDGTKIDRFAIPIFNY